ncbi:MAG: C39 family peptidase [Acidobacteria bacterium]|nr:C39 family peptidase [Acidobacteriota bacterium]
MRHCAGPPLVGLCLAALLWAGEGGVWLDVPFVRQEKNGCGAASIAMIMQYWQHQQHQPVTADAAQIEKALYSGKAHGIYASDLERYLSGRGYQVFAFQADWSDLETHLKKGRPLVAAVKPRGQKELHYVVVAGLDFAKDLVLINDPAERKLANEARLDFEKEWKATDHWTLLALPRQENSTSFSQ